MARIPIGAACAQEGRLKILSIRQPWAYLITRGSKNIENRGWPTKYRVLDVEVQRWSAMTPEQLASALEKEQVYEVELDSKTYQVEVEMLESTEEYFHVMVAVDDGSLPASMVPETQSFICNKKFLIMGGHRGPEQAKEIDPSSDQEADAENPRSH
jgi:hypothetical protein